MNEPSVELGSPIPEVQFHIPSWARDADLPEGFKGFPYFVEDLESDKPQFGNFVNKVSDQLSGDNLALVIGVVSSDDRLAYSTQAKAHVILLDGLNEPITKAEKANIQIDKLRNELDVSIYGQRSPVLKTLDFLRRSTLNPETKVEIGIAESPDESWEKHSGKLKDITINE